MITSQARQGELPKVSVVIPVYNRATAVQNAIRSVLAQTVQDFEIIVVDDGSADATPATVKAISDCRITLIRHDRNRGSSAARNTGVAACSAPYIAFLDSDDEWSRTALEKQLAVFERSNGNLGLVYIGAERIQPDGGIVRDIPQYRDDLDQILLTTNVVGGSSVAMVRRDVLRVIGPFDETLKYTEDLDLWLRIAERFKIGHVPEALVRIAQQTDHGRNSGDLALVIDGREMFYRKHREKLVSRGVLHLFFRETGWLHHRYLGDLRAARRCYRQAIVANPVSPLSYVLLAAAYLPPSWLNHAALGKRFLRQLRPSAAQGRH
jgi:glycosyltransferase involved in cell wall biosynthesis